VADEPSESLKIRRNISLSANANPGVMNVEKGDIWLGIVRIRTPGRRRHLDG